MMSVICSRVCRIGSVYEHCCKYNIQLAACSTYHTIKDIYSSNDAVGKKAKVKGWVKAVRKMKGHFFIDVDDGSSPRKLQVIIPNDNVPEGLTYGTSIETKGQLVLNQQNQVELVPEDVSVIGTCVVTDGFPFAPRKSYQPDYVRQYLHLRPRTRSFSSLMRIRHCASQALNQYFSESGFLKIDVPVMTSNDCEGAGEVFLVRPESEQIIKEMASPGVPPDDVFFNNKTYLTVSGQMHLEVMARALGKVYCLGPTFRAENSKSRLHLSEFYMAEAELAFTKSLDDVLQLIESLIKFICQNIMDNCSEDVQSYSKTLEVEKASSIDQLLKSPFTVDSYDSVCDIVMNHSDQFSQKFKKGESLAKEHELFLVKHNNDVPVFVVDWPSTIKPFYMKAHDDDPFKVHAVDLLCANVGELCGGSLREDNGRTLEKKLIFNKLEEKLAWYLELRKFGNVPTGGFGMGFERFLQVVLGIPNIKDAIPFPRWPHNCKL